MKIESAYFSRKGRKEKNEDSILPIVLSNDDVWFSAIADGMGGRPGGDVASTAAIETLKSCIEGKHITDIPVLFDAVQERLQEIAKEDSQFSMMGTTLSLVRISGADAEVGHVGDTRIYHLRGDGILDRTVDQTEVEQLLQQGILNKAAARKYPRRNVLLSVLSPSRQYDLYQDKFKIRIGDRLVLVTDGVSSKILRREIRDLSLDNKMPQSFCDSLAAEIERRLPDDDYSSVCLDIRSD